MAVLVRTRRLSNPSTLRKRKRNYGTREGRSWSTFSAKVKAKKKRKNPGRMSLKQKLHFGTLRQRAAARLALRGKKKNPGLSKLRRRGLHMSAQYRSKVKSKLGRGGYTFSKRNPSRKRRIKNVGEIVSISLAGLNPGKRKRITGMAKRRRARKVNAGGYKRRRRVMRSNPARRRRVTRMSHRRRSNPVMGHRRRRRNPGMYMMRRINRGRRRHSNPGIGGMTSGVIGQALGVIGGMIGSKYITQLALGGNNSGYMGYAGNLVASLGLGWAAGKVTKNKSFGVSVTVGGVGALILRILQDQTPLGQYVNLSLAGMGKAGDLGLGIIQDSSFPVPQVAQPGSMTSFITPRQTRQYVGSAVSAATAQSAQMSAAGSKGVSGMGVMRGRARRAIM